MINGFLGHDASFARNERKARVLLSFDIIFLINRRINKIWNRVLVNERKTLDPRWNEEKVYVNRWKGIARGSSALLSWKLKSKQVSMASIDLPI